MMWLQLSKHLLKILLLTWIKRNFIICVKRLIDRLYRLIDDLVRFPVVDSGLPDVELQHGKSSIAVAAMSKDRLNNELLLIVLSYSQRIGADGIVDGRAMVADVCRDPLAGH